MDEKNFKTGDGLNKRCPYCYELIHADAVKCRYCKSFLDTAESAEPGKRATSEKMLLGVCSRLADKYLIPVTLVRLFFVLVTFFHGFGILLYLVLWAILPGLGAEESKASGCFKALRRFFVAVKKAFQEEIVSSGPDSGKKADTVSDTNCPESR